MDADAANRFHSFKLGASAPPTKRPTSHHRRRSSVSTRRESAELMGVSLPDLPQSDDLGDKDSIRRRALWALEGKPDMPFAKVEIPEPFEFPTKPSFPPGSGAKRDSFGKLFGSSASKDQLGTLVEEEEEDEEASHPPPKATRHRPASLNLRPLSLVRGTLVSTAPGNLPTPTLTPASSRKSVFDDTQTLSSRRFSHTFSASASTPLKKRRSSISYKRSTDPILRDMFSLPTPEMTTPTDHRFSCPSDQDSHSQQPLSVADQHFLFRSHHVLLSRITELERNLRTRASQSRPISFTSDTSAQSSEPSDEMLQLISDLKAERDELKRDVDGWRQRVADADKHATMLAKRIEAERRDAWVARSRLGLLEVEKSTLETSMGAKDDALSQSLAENARLARERDAMKDEIMRLNARLKDADAAVDECTRLRDALEQERARRKELEKLLDDAGLLNTPKVPLPVNRKPTVSVLRPRGLGFQSVDSESSTTDVESVDDSFIKAEFTLDVVTEEEAELSDEDNGLAGYEDEEDSDLSFSSPGGSSIGSADELDVKSTTETRSVSPPIPAQPIHQSRPSLSKTWTFPRGMTDVPVRRDDEVDRFFGCLDDISGSPPLCHEMNQSAFASAFRSVSDDELPPFVLPSDVGVVVESTSSRNLDVVPEEDEDVADDDLVGESVEDGVRFAFHPPPIICVTPPGLCATPPPEIRITPPPETCMATPAVRPRAEGSVSSRPVSVAELVEDDEDESTLNFVFPSKTRPRPVETTPPRSSPPSRPSSRSDSSPSSIPRAISLRSMSPKTPSITFTPSKNVSGRFTAPSAYTTPLAKKTASSIPQPVISPKLSTPTKVQTSVISSKRSHSGAPNGSTFKPHSKLFMTNDAMSAFRCPSLTQSAGARSKVNGTNSPDLLAPSDCEYSYAQGTSSSSSPSSSITFNPLAARSPFQKLSHLISFSWTPGAAAVASYLVPSSSGGQSVEVTESADSQSGVGSGATRRFVPKTRQLEKLKSRLGMEKKNGMTPCFMVNACKGCSAGEVYM